MQASSDRRFSTCDFSIFFHSRKPTSFFRVALVHKKLTYLSTSSMLSLLDEIAELALLDICPSSLHRIRSLLGVENARLVAAIVNLQARAKAKFGPGLWLGTEQAISQSTIRCVAKYKAHLLGPGMAYDLCGGLGGDSMELAKRGPLISIESSEQIAAMAAVNLALDSRYDALSGTNTSNSIRSAKNTAVICSDVTQFELPLGAAFHIDPDRRPYDQNFFKKNSLCSPAPALAAVGRLSSTQTRRCHPEYYSPPLSFICKLAKRSNSWLAKFAPTANFPNEKESKALLLSSHRQWISCDGEVREQTLIGGNALAVANAQEGGRSAVKVLGTSAFVQFSVSRGTVEKLRLLDRDAPETATACKYVFDLDPALRAAGLSSVFASKFDWQNLGGVAGFWTGDNLPLEDYGLVQCFQTLWHGQVDLSRLKQVIKQRGLLLHAVKVRGINIDPAYVLQRLRGDIIKAKNRGGKPPLKLDLSLKDHPFENLERKYFLLLGRNQRRAFAVVAEKVIPTAISTP